MEALCPKQSKRVWTEIEMSEGELNIHCPEDFYAREDDFGDDRWGQGSATYPSSSGPGNSGLAAEGWITPLIGVGII